jgi:cellulose biosynthesis protein BcsQ
VKVLAVYNLKGGVGKTATAVNLSYLSAAQGARTLLWDLDPQGAATWCFRVKPRVKGGARGIIRRRHRLAGAIRGTDYDDLDLVPADFSYRNMDLVLDAAKHRQGRLRRIVARLRGDYDLVVLDCAPGASLVSDNVFRASDALLLPVIPTPLSLRAYAQLVDHLDRMRQRLRVMPFFSMVDRRKVLHRNTVVRWALEHPETLRTDIPYASQVEQMSIERAPVPCTAPRSAAARAYRALWAEVRERL